MSAPEDIHTNSNHNKNNNKIIRVRIAIIVIDAGAFGDESLLQSCLAQ